MNRTELATLLALPKRGPAPEVRSRTVEPRDGYVVETLALDLGAEKPVRGLLTRPEKVTGKLSAVLYCHAHGAKYDIGAGELLEKRPSFLSAYGPLLAAEGFITLCIDVATFGERQQPAESALSKALLWHGKTLMGNMLGDLLAAFGYLAGRDDVDASKIAAFGLSMGATHAYFLGALEPRFNRIAHLCCYADWDYLVRTGAHDLHGHYMTIPGLLAKTSVGAIAGMIAPRPQLICVGYQDPLTPKPAVERALEETRVAYARANAPEVLTLVEEAETGHVETPKTREAVLAFLRDMKG
ncbi:MAG TPA: hypothetical protein VMF90_23455 [Rhizobiaceae bacterium]|nr:hypothetical protein [Rhizobiaceae bacterium]